MNSLSVLVYCENPKWKNKKNVRNVGTWDKPCKLSLEKEKCIIKGSFVIQNVLASAFVIEPNSNYKIKLAFSICKINTEK